MLVSDAAAQRKQITVCLLPKKKGLPYFTTCAQGAEEAAKELGHVKLIYDGPSDGAPEKAASMIEKWTLQGVDVIAVSPNDPEVLAPADEEGARERCPRHYLGRRRRARHARVPSEPSHRPGHRVRVGGHDGQRPWRRQREGEVAIITATLTAANQNAWIKHMKERLAKYPKLTLVSVQPSNEDQKLAFQAAQDLMKAHPRLRGIFAISSVAFPGAAEAVKQASAAGKVLVTGLSTPNDMRSYVMDGTVKSVILWNTIDLGYLTVRVADALAAGKLKTGRYDVRRRTARSETDCWRQCLARCHPCVHEREYRTGTISDGQRARLFLIWLVPTLPISVFSAAIDRHALVTRHNVVLTKFDPENPLQVGNGEFAFTADVTGLQTFAEAFEKTIPARHALAMGLAHVSEPGRLEHRQVPIQGVRRICTDARWATPTCPATGERRRSTGCARNPHRLHLGRIGFLLTKADGTAAQPSDLTDIEQTLDLWNGILVSRFKFEGQPVDVQTVCHPIARSARGARGVAAGCKKGRLGIQIAISLRHGRDGHGGLDQARGARDNLKQPEGNAGQFTRRLDNDSYSVAATWTPAGKLDARWPSTRSC